MVKEFELNLDFQIQVGLKLENLLERIDHLKNKAIYTETAF